jgi:hypothetical protein
MREHSVAGPAAVLDPRPGAVPRAVTTSQAAPDRQVLRWASLATRLLGAVAVLVVGAVHLQAYGGPYAAVPTIGVLFLLNVAAAAVIGVALLLPLERLTGRWAGRAVVAATLAGIGLAAGSLAMLIVAERGTLFGFHEPGYDPEAIARSRAAEIAAICLLTVSLVTRWLATHPHHKENNR